MKNYVQAEDVITVPAPYAVASGVGCLVGNLFGIVQTTAAQGAAVALVSNGVFDVAKTAGDAPALGAILYWDNTARSLTVTAAGNKRVGVAVRAALGADATVRIRLDGVAV